MESGFLAIYWGEGKEGRGVSGRRVCEERNTHTPPHFQLKHLHPSEDASQIWQLWYIHLLSLFSIFNLWIVKHLKKKKNKPRLLLKAPQLDLESLMGAMDRARTTLRGDPVRLTNRITTSAPWVTDMARVVVRGSLWTWNIIRSYYCSFNNQPMNASILFHIKPNSGHIFTYTNACMLHIWVNTCSAVLLVAHCSS